MGEFQTLCSRLKSLKGWLTSTINACDNVLAMPHSIASSSFLKARILDSIVELDKRLLKINNCLEQLQALELEKPNDDDRKKREESYANSRDRAAKSHQDCLNKLFERFASEFKLCNHQLQMGSTREVVLMDLGRRNGVDDLKTLASVMIQVDKFGTSVGKALRIQSDAMRTRRRQIAEEKAAKTAVKLIVPLVLFIFPGIFVILVGPAALTMINEMLPLMSGQ